MLLASKKKWHRRFCDLASLIATWSKDPSTRNGAVIVDQYNRIIATGYNGFPRGVEDTDERLNNRDLKYPLIVHAEANALHNAIADVRHMTMYCTMYPCNECAKAIVQRGIAVLITPAAPDREPWASSAKFSELMFKEANVDVQLITPELFA